MKQVLVALVCAQALGCVQERCTMDQDCPSPKVCSAGGECVYECESDEDCGAGFGCAAHRCSPIEHVPIQCPDDMVPVQNLFCVDRYEASRADATAEESGVDNSKATSRASVIPWEVGDDNATAAGACQAAGKRLCTPFEWELACRGPEGRRYGYGSSYEPETCNGIDTFGAASVKLLPTAQLAECVNGWGAYDLNGNLWEHVADGDGTSVRGGAYNCIDSMTLHRCDYVPRTWVPSALGFRCCWTPPEAEPEGDTWLPTDTFTPVTDAETTGCLDPDVDGDANTEAVTPQPCASDEECAQEMGGLPPCQVAHCANSGQCESAADADGTPCEDEDQCSLGDTCTGGSCAAGPGELNCEDLNPCTQDACMPNSGCSHVPAAAACTDGDPCTLGDHCDGGECLPGQDAPNCDDGNPCTDDACVVGEGCASTPNSADCDDDNPCTWPDQCMAGQCVGLAAVCECEEDDDCPFDSNLCNGFLVCDKTAVPFVCVVAPGSKVDCLPPGNVCLSATCNPATGQCETVPMNGKPCDDQDPCTTNDMCGEGSCSGSPGLCQCTTDADCLAMEDGNLCNGTLTCNKAVFPYACQVDATTVVTCPVLPDPCKEFSCVAVTGQCIEGNKLDGTPCDDANPCTGGDSCAGGTCVAGQADLCACPPDMVLIDGKFCMDVYEASRPDATAWSQGTDGSKATSRVGVMPWFPVDLATASGACAAAAKRVCTEAEMNLSCGGLNGWAYVYGDAYSPTVCNGIDAFCDCTNPLCAGLETCPYPHCYSMSPEGEWGQGCGAWFHVTATGAFPECVNAWGAFDVNGNVWELVDLGNGESWYKGGAYNCGNSEYLHDCAGLFQDISAKGFRCCKDAAVLGVTP